MLVPAGAAGGMELRDLHFGEALFHAYQDDYFDALERLDAEIAGHYGSTSIARRAPIHIKNAEYR